MKLFGGLVLWILFLVVLANPWFLSAWARSWSFFVMVVVTMFAAAGLPAIFAALRGEAGSLVRAWHSADSPWTFGRLIALLLLAAGVAVAAPGIAALEARLGLSSLFDGFAELRGRMSFDDAGYGAMGYLPPWMLAAHFAFAGAALRELFYRGFLQRYVLSSLSRPLRGLLVAILFTLATAPPDSVLVFLFHGLLFGFLAEYFESVGPAIFVAAVTNRWFLFTIAPAAARPLAGAWWTLGLAVVLGVVACLARGRRATA